LDIKLEETGALRKFSVVQGANLPKITKSVVFLQKRLRQRTFVLPIFAALNREDRQQALDFRWSPGFSILCF
jgi:hypothetical protein